MIRLEKASCMWKHRPVYEIKTTTLHSKIDFFGNTICQFSLYVFWNVSTYSLTTNLLQIYNFTTNKQQLFQQNGFSRVSAWTCNFRCQRSLFLKRAGYPNTREKSRKNQRITEWCRCGIFFFYKYNLQQQVYQKLQSPDTKKF